MAHQTDLDKRRRKVGAGAIAVAGALILLLMASVLEDWVPVELVVILIVAYFVVLFLVWPRYDLWGKTIAEIMDIKKRDDGVVETNLKLKGRLLPPLAPSALFKTVKYEEKFLELHKLLGSEGRVYRFESYDIEGKLPAVGETGILGQEWTPNQFSGIADKSKVWKPATFVKSESWDHEHCLLCWVTIYDEDSGATDGYDWLCEKCHKKYIVDDFLHLRE